MTETPVLMPLYMPFTEAQMANIRLGYVPVAMEQKWFTYFADSALHIYRSWTGFYMFRIHFEPRTDGWRATHAGINMDPLEPEPGPPLHPRPDEHGKPVKIKHPSTPTKLCAWHDTHQSATVIPDGPMPTQINGVPFAPWADAPTTLIGWKKVPGQMGDLVEPLLHVGVGKHAAAGVVVEEADGRVWIVHPSNGFGGYSATFPKGRADALGSHLQAVAIREAHEEAGLQVQITGFLADSQRTMTTTRYYLARRVGGNPADMGWESQAVSLVPRAVLPSLLTNSNDAPLLKALLKQAD